MIAVTTILRGRTVLALLLAVFSAGFWAGLGPRARASVLAASRRLGRRQ